MEDLIEKSKRLYVEGKIDSVLSFPIYFSKPSYPERWHGFGPFSYSTPPGTYELKKWEKECERIDSINDKATDNFNSQIDAVNKALKNENDAKRYPRIMRDWNGRKAIVNSRQEETNFLKSITSLT